MDDSFPPPESAQRFSPPRRTRLAVAAPNTEITGRSRRPAYEWLLAGLSWLAAVNQRAPLLAVGSVLPLLQADLHLSATAAGALSSVPLLLTGLVSIPAGLVADRAGPLRVLAAAQVVLTVAGLARAFSNDVLPLFLMTAILGAAIGFGQPSLALIAREARTMGASVATSIYTNGYTVGALATFGLSVPVLMPLFGWSWRGVFVAWSIYGAVVSLAWLLISVRDYQATRGRKKSEEKRGNSLSILAALQLPGLALVAWLFLAQGIMYYGLGAWLPSFLVSEGWSLAQASLTTTILQLGSVTASASVPLLTRSFGTRPPLILGAAAATVGVAGMLVAPAAGGFLWAAFMGAGVSFVFVLSLSSCSILAPPGQVGMVAGVVLALGFVGAIVGPSMVGVLRDLSGGFRAGFLLLLLVSAGMTLAALRVPEGKQEA